MNYIRFVYVSYCSVNRRCCRTIDLKRDAGKLARNLFLQESHHMPQFDMKIVPEAAVQGHDVIEHTAGSPVKEGDSNETYRCGACKTKLFVNVSHHEAHGLVVKCGKCGKINADPHH